MNVIQLKTIILINLIAVEQVYSYNFQMAPSITWLPTEGRVFNETKVYQITIKVSNICQAWDKPLMPNKFGFLKGQQEEFKKACLAQICRYGGQDVVTL